MKKQFLNIVLVLILLILNLTTCLAEQTLNLGIIIDGKNLEYITPMIEKELGDLLNHKAQINIENKNIINANWSKNQAFEAYNKLKNSMDVDFIIGIGMITSNVISTQDNFTKPTICYGYRHTNLDSEIKNLAYISAKPNKDEYLSKLSKVFPYKKLAVVSLLSKKTDDNDNHIVVDEKNLLSILENDDTFDAVYLGYMGQKEGNYKKELIKKLSHKGYPVFGYSKEDLINGAYAVYTTDSELSVNIKNMAMIIDDYIDGKQIKSFMPSKLSNGYVVVNLQTAKKIKTIPSYDVLREVVIYNENSNSKVEPIDIKQVILYALENNLDLSSEKIQSQISKRKVQLSKRNFFPSISIGPSFYFVDEAYSSLISERSGSLNATLNQLIYSDKAISNILASKDLEKAQEYKQAQKTLETIKKASQVYLDILKAQNQQNIYKNLLEFSRKNLELREKAQKLGQIPMSDIYRWKAEYSMHQNNYINATSQTKKQHLKLNKVLNKPINTILIPVDITLNSSMFMSFENQKIKEIVDNPISSDIFADYLCKKALSENPILKASAEQIKATHRMANFYKRQNFIPTINLQSQVMTGMYDAGKGPKKSSEKTTYLAGIFANWNIFDGDKTRINYKKSKLEIKQLKDQRQILMNNIEYGIRSGLTDLVAKSANIDLSNKSTDYAKKNLDLIQKSYNLGELSIISLLDAKNTESKAQMQYINSVYDYLFAVINLQTQVGTYNILSNDESQKDLYLDFKNYLSKKEKL